EIRNDLEVMMEDKKASISYSQLPSIDASPTLIYQLFYNLILNSLKFAKDNKPSQIVISSNKISNNEIDYLEIIVSDNGIGFTQQKAESIFDTFTRLNPSSRYEGTGLGL